MKENRKVTSLDISKIDWESPRKIIETVPTIEDMLRYEAAAKELAAYEGILRELETVVMQFRSKILNSEYLDGAFPLIKSREGFVSRALYENERSITGLKIVYKEPVMEIHIPAIMPHRTARPSLFYEEMLRNYLTEYRFWNEEQFNQYYHDIKDGVDIFIRSFVKTKTLIRDADNLSMKALIDELVRCMYLKEDAGHYLALHLLTEYSETTENSTVIYLVPKSYGLGFMEKLRASTVDEDIDSSTIN